MKQLTLNQLITLVILTVAGGILLLSTYSYFSTSRIKIGSELYGQIIESNDLIADVLPPPQYIVEAFLITNEMLRANESEKAGLKKRFDETYEEFKAGQVRWKASNLPSELKTLITQETASPAEKFYTEANAVFFPALQKDDQAVLNASLERLKAFYQQNRIAVNKIVSLGTARKNSLEASTEKTISSSRILFFLVSFVTVVGTVTLSIFGNRIIKERLAILTQSIQRIGHGDLRSRVDINVNDEFGEAALLLNNTAQKLSSMIAEVVDLSSQLSSAALQAQKLCDRSVDNMDQQHNLSIQLATGMTQISGAINSVSRDSLDTLNFVDEVKTAAQQSINNMSLYIHKMQSISANMDKTAMNIDQLNELSGTIGSVLDVIRGIADQTNLLALNAAIEAARAGEQGRGFAVVADEVRSLASKTGNSTTEIQQMIERLQSTTTGAVSEMRIAKNETTQGVADASQVGSLLNNLSNAVNHIREKNAEISSNSEEQNAVTRDFNTQLQGMASLTEQTASAMHEIKQMTQNLAHLASQQHKMAVQFQI